MSTKKEIDKLIIACTSANKIAIEYLNEHITRLDARKKEIEQEILSIRQNVDNLMQIFRDVDIDSVPDIIQSGSFEDKRLLCRYFILNITYATKENITIEYSI